MGRLYPIVALVLGVLVLGVPEPVGALEADAPLDAIERCMADNLKADSSVQSIELIPRDRLGSERTMAAKVYWKRFDDGFSRVLARFTAPEDIEGAGFLLVETDSRADMFLYMPEIRKTRRITTQSLRGQIYGTDFSYEDFERLQGFNHSEPRERLEDGEVDGRAVWVLGAKPDPESGSAYERVLTYVDQEYCVPIKTELFTTGEQLRKVLVVDASTVARSGEAWVPRDLTMQDLRDETQTRLKILEVEVGREIPNRAFRLDRLSRKRDP